jgi:putative salt-induced outer membrane protein YdiY
MFYPLLRRYGDSPFAISLAVLLVHTFFLPVFAVAEREGVTNVEVDSELTKTATLGELGHGEADHSMGSGTVGTKPSSNQPDVTPVSPWRSGVQLGASLSRGNSRASLFSGRVDSAYNDRVNVLNFKADHQWGEDQDSTSLDASEAGIDYKRVFSSRAFFGASSLLERDQPAGVKYRGILSPMLGRYLAREQRFDFRVEAGPAVVFEELAGVNDYYLGPRVSQGLEYRLDNANRIFQEVSSTWRSQDRFLLKSELGVEAALNSRLSLVFTLEYDFNSKPPEQKKRGDLSLVSSLRVAL